MDPFSSIVTGGALRLSMRLMFGQRAASVLVGVFEGFYLHFSRKNTPKSVDPYLAFGIRLVLDLAITGGPWPLVTCLWTALIAVASSAVSSEHGHDTVREKERERSSRRRPRSPERRESRRTTTTDRPVRTAVVRIVSPNSQDYYPQTSTSRTRDPGSVRVVAEELVTPTLPPSTPSTFLADTSPPRSSNSLPRPAFPIPTPPPTTTDHDTQDTRASPRSRLSTVPEESTLPPESVVPPHRTPPPRPESPSPPIHYVQMQQHPGRQHQVQQHQARAIQEVISSPESVDRDELATPPPSSYLRPRAPVHNNNDSEPPSSPEIDRDELLTPQRGNAHLTIGDELQTPPNLIHRSLSPLDFSSGNRTLMGREPVPLGSILFGENNGDADRGVRETRSMLDETQSMLQRTPVLPVPAPLEGISASGIATPNDPLSSPSPSASLILGTAADVRSEAELLRQEAWSSRGELKALEAKLASARRRGDKREVFILEGDVVELKKKVSKLHDSAARRYYHGK